MSFGRFFVSSVLVVGAVTSAVGCTAGAHDDAAASDDALTGVTDLAEMEAALGLFKDEKDPETGNYYRSEAKLAAGPCYQKLKVGQPGSKVQFRRYSSGAAFFVKEGSAIGAGAERPVLCVDVDISDGSNNGGEYTVSVSDIEIDAVLRYRLGAPTGGDGAAGTFYDGFAHGSVSTHGGYCPQDGFEPLAKDALSLYCFGAVDFPGNSQMDGSLQLAVYQYAYKKASATNRFSMKADPVGRFVSMEGTYEDQHVRFEKLDGHSKQAADGNITTIWITPKGSDAALDANAIVKCTLSSNAKAEKYDVQCTGL